MDSIPNQKHYVISGATSGIGLATAEILARRGQGIIGLGRSAGRCQDAERRLRSLNPAAQVDYRVVDLSLQSEVRRAAQAVEAILDERGVAGLDGLANVAGTFTYWLDLTPDGVEKQWAVNHLAGFLLTRLLLPRLQAASQARVVTVSSDSHYGAHMNWADPQLRRHYNGLSAYGVTKLANVLFTLELNRRYGDPTGLRAFAADPGLVKTDIGLKGTPGLAAWVWKVRRSGGIPAEQAAQGVVFLLCEPGLQERQEIYWKHGQPRRTSRAAQDGPAAERLWGLSERLCGLAEVG